MLYIIVYNKNSILICEIKVSWLEKTGCLLCYPCNFVYLHFESGEKFIDNIRPPRMCPSGSEGQTCGKIGRISFRFLLAEKWKKIY